MLRGVCGFAGGDDVEEWAQGREAGAADGDAGLGGGPQRGVDVVPGRVVQDVEAGEDDETDDGDDADEAAAEEDGGQDGFLGTRGTEAPEKGNGHDPDCSGLSLLVERDLEWVVRDLHVKDDIDAAAGEEEFGNVDAVARDVWVPQLLDWNALEDDSKGRCDQGSNDERSNA